MSDTQSNRSVLPFPAELRLEIYRNLFSKTYLAFSMTPTHHLSELNGNLEPLTASAGLVILRVSKATSSEALKLLYEESVFLFKIDFEPDCLPMEPPQKMAVVLMKNVSFDILTNTFKQCYGSVAWYNAGPSSQALGIRYTMKLFTNTAYFRNIMRVNFKDCTDNTFFSGPENFDKAMKDLRKLVLEFKSTHVPKSDESSSCSEQAQAVSRSQSQSQSQPKCEEYKDLLLKNYFEPAYGPAAHRDLHDICNGSYAYYLEFHPRQYMAKNLIVNVGKMLEEAARLTAVEHVAGLQPKIFEILINLTAAREDLERRSYERT